jgi:serine/threonine protein kinase
VVYAAEDTVLGREVAIKVTSTFSERLEREARVIAGLEHPGIVPVHDLGTLPDGSAYYVMKRVHGERLDRWCAAGPPLAERLRLFQRICEAVAFAHERGVIHRDLKPENVMIGAHGEALVMDWGLARALGSTEPVTGEPSSDAPAARTRSGVVMGTPAYMAPEQARGEARELDRTADVYALGAILYFVVAGRPPFDAPSSQEIIAQVLAGPPPPLAAPRALVSICGKAMARAAAQRYPTAGELGEDVARYLDGFAPRAHRDTWVERLARFATRNRVLLSLLLAYVLVRLVVIALSR